ncbi:DUF86 domain-containing protein [Halobacteriales archaeon QH_6_64_20]|nr:MAG: DUF86 domain-containing protein [Halobacteriales archaeon QH_6_64_20]
MIDPDRVTSKLGSLETYLRGLAEKQGCSWEEYRRDRDLQDIVERRFEKATRASLSVASHIVAAEGFREPTNYGDLFRMLEAERILSSATADEMAEMAGFRNVLAYEYADIVDERVYDHLQDIERFERYGSAIHDFLNDQ